MKRRTLIQVLMTPLAAVRLWAQTAAFPGKRAGALRGLAAVVLPSSLGRAGTDRVADRFTEWVRGYRAGADLEHGYGFPRVRSKPALPVGMYLEQLDALGEFPAREAVLQALTLANGPNIAADLMTFYFNSSEANDLCYRARIQRDACRGLQGSENPPPSL